MNIEKSYNFRKVNVQVTTSGVVPVDVLKTLSKEGYEVVINLLPEDHEHSVPNEKQIVESQGIDYFYIPVVFTEPRLAELEEFLSRMKAIDGKKVHIHCAANWRVSAFYSVFSVLNGSWNQVEAQEFITTTWNPKEHPAWCELLKKYGINV